MFLLYEMSSSLPSMEDKRSLIEAKIEQMFQNPNKSDLLALDLEINLLICALESYKHETVLKPFPTTFLSDSNNNKDFAKLVSSLAILWSPYGHVISISIEFKWILEAYGPVIADVAGVANKDKAVQLGPAVIGVLVFCPQGLYAGVYEWCDTGAAERVE